MVAIARAVPIDAQRRHHGRADLVAGAARGRHAVRGRSAAARRRASRIVYVSHRLDELYRICDRVTVLRDGRLVHTGPTGSSTGCSSSSLMLGRDVAERAPARRHRRSPASTRPPAATPVLRAERPDAARTAGRRRRSTCAPGEVVGLAGLLGSGRSETAKAIFGALPLDARDGRPWTARPLRRRSTAAAIRAGSALLPEDRKAEGIIPDAVRAREHRARRAAPALAGPAWCPTRKQRRDRRDLHDAAADQGVQPGPEGRRAVRRQPAEGAARPAGSASDPKVLLLDEPTRGIDVGAKAEVQALIDELAERGARRAADLLRRWRSWSRAPTASWCCATARVVGDADRRRGHRGRRRWPRSRRTPPPDGRAAAMTTAPPSRPAGVDATATASAAWLQDYGVYAAVARAAGRSTSLLTPQLPRRWRNLRIQLVQVAPGR